MTDHFFLSIHICPELCMILFTQAQRERLFANGASEDEARDPFPVAKLHLPGTGCIWLLTELDGDDPDLAFGLCDLGMQSPELGYVDLCELAACKLPLNITIQRDDSFIGLYPISVYAAAARECGAITEDQDILRRHQFPRRNHGLRPV